MVYIFQRNGLKIVVNAFYKVTVENCQKLVNQIFNIHQIFELFFNKTDPKTIKNPEIVRPILITLTIAKTNSNCL